MRPRGWRTIYIEARHIAGIEIMGYGMISRHPMRIWASALTKTKLRSAALGAMGIFFTISAAAQVEHIGRAVAIVNDQVISEYDVEQRMTLVLASTGAQLSAPEQRALRTQVMRTLVDEKLQAQEASEYDISVTPDIVQEQFARVASNFNQTPAQFEEFLQQNGTSRAAFEDKIKSDITWSQLVQRRLDPLINIGDEEIEEVLQRLEDAKGQFEYNLSEIYIGFTPETEANIQQTAARIAARVREGASFEAFARQFSEAATAAVGGDLDWVIEDQLDPTLRAAVGELRVNQVSDPIRAPGGYYVVLMKDRRQILSADPLDTQFDLQQIFWAAENGEDDAEIKALEDKARSVAANVTSCEQVADAAGAHGASDQGPIGQLRLRDLPPDLQEELRTMEVGQVTKPVSFASGVRLFIVCDRQEPQVSVPTEDDIYAQLNQQRLAMMARRYLRDLRRDAIVDYK